MNLGMPEMLFIVLIALVVFGPRRLPELARQLGKVMGEFKRASNEFKQQLESEIDTLDHQERQQKIMPPDASEASGPEGTVISSLITSSGAPEPPVEQAEGYQPPPAVRSTKITTPRGDLVPLPPPDPSKLSSFLRPAEAVPQEATVPQGPERYPSEQHGKGPNG